MSNSLLQVYKNWKNNLNLLKFNNNKYIIDYNSINYFVKDIKENNDKNNKMRENIINCIINDILPHDFYKYSNRWKKLKKSIHIMINDVCKLKQLDVRNIINYKSSIKAGRIYKYDLLLQIKYKSADIIELVKFKIELKFNISDAKETPQIVSPYKPSLYIINEKNISYEEYYYDNYLYKLCEKFDLITPNKDVYISTINNNNPKCIEHLKKLYKENIEFQSYAKKYSKISIEEYLSFSKLNIEKLQKYIIESQSNKIYTLYKNGTFIIEELDISNYFIKSSELDSKYKNKYICQINNNTNQLNCLLRWKNGNGIAFPAFQISLVEKNKKYNTNI